jgi:hypothetical protein
MSDLNLTELMQQDYLYPAQDDLDIQEKLYRKLEFNAYKIQQRPELKDFAAIQQYRDNICGKPMSFSEHQQMLSNLINPDTPYRGLLVMHGLGTGKTGVGIAIAEKFKEQVSKYNTKIHILVPGPNLKETWKSEIIKSTGNTYVEYTDKSLQNNDAAMNNALLRAMQYYRIMSYRSFFKKVLGDRILEVVSDKDNSKKVKYRKIGDEYERDVSADRIYDLNDTLLIIDEAHNVTGNYGDAVKHIIKSSKNLKILLLTATPMKNLADDVLFLINLLRPAEDPINRDTIFTSHKNHEMILKENGEKYFRQMIRGYVSYLRGADPLIFATRIDVGIIPKSLLFTKIVPCVMSAFQRAAYDNAKHITDDSLDRHSEDVSNFVFPGLDNNQLVGVFGKEGIHSLRNQLRSNGSVINAKLGTLLNAKEDDLIRLGNDGKTIEGSFLELKHLYNFSTKFYQALKNINKMIWGKHGVHTGFIYSNLVKIGINLFEQIMLQNGYIEYNENPVAYDTTRCYYCGVTRGQHTDNVVIKSKKHGDINVPKHVYHPAAFIKIIGKGSSEVEELPDELAANIRNVFNNPKNIEGKYIKFLLGSSVIKEGLNTKYIGEVHILDVYFNFGRVDQVVGRAIRRCSHYELVSEKNVYPEVFVYKYAISLGDNTLSTEESLYQKAELKHILVKRVERIMKEEAIDCALNMSGNIFRADIEKYKNCIPNKTCPALCDYMPCEFKCSNNVLNEKYYDPKLLTYRDLRNDELDKTTYSHNLAKNEIAYVKTRIKELFFLNYVYTLNAIESFVELEYKNVNKSNYNSYYVHKALDSLLPTTENDFNNFRDYVFDKYNRPGYLIYVNNFYIYHPFELKENIPMYYRLTYDRYVTNPISIENYIKYSENAIKYQNTENVEQVVEGYDFESVWEYYSSRPEFDIVGVIDKEPDHKKLKTFAELEDTFKIRMKLKKNTTKKRETGLQTVLGTVCFNSQSKEKLVKIAHKLGVNIEDRTRIESCNVIRDKLLNLERMATGKQKMTYMIIPKNHPIYPFPYNLEDRIEYIVNQINHVIRSDINITIDKYTITIHAHPVLVDHKSFLLQMNATMDTKGNFVINVQ